MSNMQDSPSTQAPKNQQNNAEQTNAEQAKIQQVTPPSQREQSAGEKVISGVGNFFGSLVAAPIRTITHGPAGLAGSVVGAFDKDAGQKLENHLTKAGLDIGVAKVAGTAVKIVDLEAGEDFEQGIKKAGNVIGNDLLRDGTDAVVRLPVAPIVAIAEGTAQSYENAYEGSTAHLKDGENPGVTDVLGAGVGTVIGGTLGILPELGERALGAVTGTPEASPQTDAAKKAAQAIENTKVSKITEQDSYDLSPEWQRFMFNREGYLSGSGKALLNAVVPSEKLKVTGKNITPRDIEKSVKAFQDQFDTVAATGVINEKTFLRMQEQYNKEPIAPAQKDTSPKKNAQPTRGNKPKSGTQPEHAAKPKEKPQPLKQEVTPNTSPSPAPRNTPRPSISPQAEATASPTPSSSPEPTGTPKAEPSATQTPRSTNTAGPITTNSPLPTRTPVPEAPPQADTDLEKNIPAYESNGLLHSHWQEALVDVLPATETRNLSIEATRTDKKIQRSLVSRFQINWQLAGKEGVELGVLGDRTKEALTFAHGHQKINSATPTSATTPFLEPTQTPRLTPTPTPTYPLEEESVAQAATSLQRKVDMADLQENLNGIAEKYGVSKIGLWEGYEADYQPAEVSKYLPQIEEALGTLTSKITYPLKDTEIYLNPQTTVANWLWTEGRQAIHPEHGNPILAIDYRESAADIANDMVDGLKEYQLLTDAKQAVALLGKDYEDALRKINVRFPPRGLFENGYSLTSERPTIYVQATDSMEWMEHTIKSGIARHAEKGTAERIVHQINQKIPRNSVGIWSNATFSPEDTQTWHAETVIDAIRSLTEDEKRQLQAVPIMFSNHRSTSFQKNTRGKTFIELYPGHSSARMTQDIQAKLREFSESKK